MVAELRPIFGIARKQPARNPPNPLDPAMDHPMLRGAATATTGDAAVRAISLGMVAASAAGEAII